MIKMRDITSLKVPHYLTDEQKSLYGDLVSYFANATNADITRDYDKLYREIRECELLPICIWHDCIILPFKTTSSLILNLIEPYYRSYYGNIRTSAPKFTSIENGSTLDTERELFNIPYTRLNFEEDLFGYRKSMTHVHHNNIKDVLIQNDCKDIYINSPVRWRIIDIFDTPPPPEVFKTWAIGPMCYDLSYLFEGYPYHPQIKHWNVSLVMYTKYMFARSGVRDLSMLHFDSAICCQDMFNNSSLEKMPKFKNVRNGSCMFSNSNIINTDNFNPQYLDITTCIFSGCKKLEAIFNNCVFKHRPVIDNITQETPNLISMFNNCKFEKGLSCDCISTYNEINLSKKIQMFNNCGYVYVHKGFDDINTDNYTNSYKNTIFVIDYYPQQNYKFYSYEYYANALDYIKICGDKAYFVKR